MKNIKPTVLTSIFIIFCSINFGQAKSNFEQINLLIEKSVKQIAEKADNLENSYNLEITTPSQYLVFKNRILNSFNNSSLNITTEPGEKSSKIIYSLENVQVDYSDLFRDGLFGDYQIEREVFISGVYTINETGRLISDEINLAVSDTVAYDSLHELENSAFPFTQSDPPAEPFLSGLLEPAIAIGTAALTIILFFTVRSK